jgi:hypothetical protein
MERSSDGGRENVSRLGEISEAVIDADAGLVADLVREALGAGLAPKSAFEY